MKSAGLGDLSVDQLISLKIQGVTPEYVKQMHDAGLHPDADELIGMKVQGITPDYVRDMRSATGQALDIDNLIGLRVQGRDSRLHQTASRSWTEERRRNYHRDESPANHPRICSRKRAPPLVKLLTPIR